MLPYLIMFAVAVVTSAFCWAIVRRAFALRDRCMLECERSIEATHARVMELFRLGKANTLAEASRDTAAHAPAVFEQREYTDEEEADLEQQRKARPPKPHELQGPPPRNFNHERFIAEEIEDSL